MTDSKSSLTGFVSNGCGSLQRGTFTKEQARFLRRSGVELALTGDVPTMRFFTGDAVVAACAWTEANSDKSLTLRGDIVSARILSLPDVAFGSHFHGTIGELYSRVNRDGEKHPLLATAPSLEAIIARNTVKQEVDAA